MVWGAIGSKSKTELQVIKGNINTQQYQEIFVKADDELKRLYPRGFTFDQAGASCHTSQSTMNWLQTSGWRVSPWPSNSPDLNPIENVWGLMKKQVGKKRPKTIQELEEIVKEVWNGLSLDYLKSLIKNMPNRIKKCIDQKGGVTGY